MSAILHRLTQRHYTCLALLVAPVLTSSVLTPAVALGCAVCGGGNPANRFAFFVSTVALSLLPLGLFTGGFLWLRSRIRTRSAGELNERADAAPAVATAEGSLPAATARDTR